MCGLLGHRSETQLGVLMAARVAQGARRSTSAAGAVCEGTGLYFSPVVVCRPCGLHTSAHSEAASTARRAALRTMLSGVAEGPRAPRLA